MLIGCFFIALAFSLDKPSDILQALASIIGSAVSGGVAAAVAIWILHREQRAQELKSVEEKDSTAKSLDMWCLRGVKAIVEVSNLLTVLHEKPEATSTTLMHIERYVGTLGASPPTTIEGRIATCFPTIISDMTLLSDVTNTLQNVIAEAQGVVDQSPDSRIPDRQLAACVTFSNIACALWMSIIKAIPRETERRLSRLKDAKSNLEKLDLQAKQKRLEKPPISD